MSSSSPERCISILREDTEDIKRHGLGRRRGGGGGGGCGGVGVHDNMYIHLRTDGRGGRVRRRQRNPYNVMTTAGTAATWKKASVARGPGCTAAANGSITHNTVAVATGAAEAAAAAAVYHYPPRDGRRGAERSNGSSSREAMMLTRPAQSQSISKTMDALGDREMEPG